MTNATTASPLSGPLAPLLDRLFDDARRADPPAIARARAEAGRLPGPPDARWLSGALGDALMPVSAEVGRLLYALARARPSRLTVEFGTSFGVSTLFLAAAARDGGGRVVTTELEPAKARRARAHLAEAGLGAFAEVREGDALETLRGLEGPIDLLFLDGWKGLYLPVLELLEPTLAPGAIVVADDTSLFPDEVATFLHYVRDPARGYVSVELPLGDGLELSLRVA